MTFIQNDKWYLSLPPCSTRVPCGDGEHTLQWDAGQLLLPAHPDSEAELVLAALGGEKAGCVGIAEAWARHADDLTMLQLGPRGPSDQITVSWLDVPNAAGEASQQAWISKSRLATAQPAPIRFSAPPLHSSHQLRHAMQAELEKARQRYADLVSLLALGPAFAFRLAGHVAIAHANQLTAANRPTLRAALSGRLALLGQDWIGIDADQVTGSLHDGDGWGTVERTRQGELRVALPADWLASVWACGLGLVAEHLVVAVMRPGWPDAQVMALRTPGADPVLLDVHGTDCGRNPAQWEI